MRGGTASPPRLLYWTRHSSMSLRYEHSIKL